MEATLARHEQAVSAHQAYLDSLHAPTLADIQRISEIQLQKENEISKKYHVHSAEEHDAATKIQAAYRGHRERREQQGLVLDPSSRWSDLIAAMKYRSVTTPHHQRPNIKGQTTRERSTSDVAKMHWRRAGWIAEHAGRGESSPSSLRTPSDRSITDSAKSDPEAGEVSSLMMDLRYFLEMVDSKHRYGANLQVYHEYWQRQTTTQNFFYWLDHGFGKHIDLALCSREKLDRERIRYLSREERKDYLVRIDEQGLLRWDKTGGLITTSVDDFKDSTRGIVPINTPDLLPYKGPDEASAAADADADSTLTHSLANFSNLSLDTHSSSDEETSSNNSSSSSNDPTTSTSPTTNPKPKPPRQRRPLHLSPATLLNHLLRSSVKPGTWIYVTDTLNRLYVSIKSSGTFQHASFLSGARIRSAGSIGVQDGRLTYLSPLSGHYRPTTKSFRDFVESLEVRGVDLGALRVSGAYKVLRGMEFYGRTKRGFGRVGGKGRNGEGKKKRGEGRKERVALEMVHETEGFSATEVVERHWEREHAGRRRRVGS